MTGASLLRHPVTIACAYGAMALFTFGHAASEAYPGYVADYNKCAANPKCSPISIPAEAATYVGIISGIVWPLYWSWELQQ